jgi:polyisoprenoid-binding protein YceI
MLWTLDPAHATVGFAVKHMGISTVRGEFRKFSASGETDEAGLPAGLAMEIDAASISTNNAQRDAHLRSTDFFAVEDFPTLTFRSSVVSGTRDRLTIAGDLTLRGVTKPVTLAGTIASPITDPWGNRRTSLALTGTIKRSEWGLTWNQALELGRLLVSDDVRLEIEAQAVSSAQSKAA